MSHEKNIREIQEEQARRLLPTEDQLVPEEIPEKQTYSANIGRRFVVGAIVAAALFVVLMLLGEFAERYSVLVNALVTVIVAIIGGIFNVIVALINRKKLG